MKESLLKELKSFKFWWGYALFWIIYDSIWMIANIILVSVKWNYYCENSPVNLFGRGLVIGICAVAILYFIKDILEQSRNIKNTKAILEGLENGNINITVDEESTDDEAVEVKDGKIQGNLAEGSEATINIK